MKRKNVKIKTFKVKKDDIVYQIIEEFEKKKIDFSKLMRDLLLSEFSGNEEFRQIKIKRLLFDRKNIKEKIKKISKELIDNEEELNNLGYSLGEFE